VRQIRGVDSEIGQLRTVLVHRPGLELERITPRHSDGLLLRTPPWVSKARQEHDVMCQELRNQGVEVLYVTELLQDVLEYQAAREEAVALAVADAALGDELRGQLRAHLEDLGPEQLAQVLIAGLTPSELKVGRGVVFELLDRHDFALDPLPNLVFTKDSSFWIGDQVAVASLAAERRRRETDLATVLYRHHPRFAGTKWIYHSALEHVDGGDVLLLAPGVVAIGVGNRTTPAGTERLARQLFDAGLVNTVLAVPIRQDGGAGHLDTLCAVVDVDSLLMHPGIAYTLTAHTISPRGDGMRITRPQPFLEAAAQAMSIGRLRVIDSGLDPAWGESRAADDGSNVLAIGRRLVVSHERNSETNARLEAAGVQVIRVPSSELGSLRGGPRCMTCPIGRDPAPDGAESTDVTRPDVRVGHAVLVAGISVPSSRAESRPTPVPAGFGAAAMAASTSPTSASWPSPAAERVAPDYIAAERLAAEQVAAARAAARRAQPTGGGTSSREARSDQDRAELASASLGAAAPRAPRAPSDPEDAERHGDDRNDQGDQGQPEQRVDDGHGNGHHHEDEHDCGNHHQQHAKHGYTVRRRRRVLLARCAAAAAARGGPWRPLAGRYGISAISTAGIPVNRAYRSSADAHLAGVSADPVVCGRWS
jgi:arginine deiminase